jgi:hypothetical protein
MALRLSPELMRIARDEQLSAGSGASEAGEVTRDSVNRVC